MTVFQLLSHQHSQVQQYLLHNDKRTSCVTCFHLFSYLLNKHSNKHYKNTIYPSLKSCEDNINHIGCEGLQGQKD